MLVLLAPGQGAQTPGLLGPWLDVDGVRSRLQWLSTAAGLDLVAAGTVADVDTIRDTRVAQPLLVAAGIVAADLLHEPDKPYAAVAGHSVGEVTVAAVAGALSPESALGLVQHRARAMAEAAAVTPTGMTAVLGGHADEVVTAAVRHGLELANHNAAGQLVVGGTLDALERFAADPPPGARLRPLQVAGAFHTAHMAPARDRLTAIAAGIPVRDPVVPVVSNADGSLVRTGHDLLERIVHQVAAPVRWDACLQTLAAMGVTAVIELPPAGTLAAIARRALPGVEVVTLNTPDDLPAAQALLDAHRLPQAEPQPAWRLLVAPIAGTFRSGRVPTGTPVQRRTPLGEVVAQRSTTPVEAPDHGVLVEWLAEDGDPVAPGQPLARLHPVSELAREPLA